MQFALFDAPTREECVVRRDRTNTPLQALSGLNDPAFWEAAQALGERMAQREGDDRQRLAFGFELCTARAPEQLELNLMHWALARERQDDPEQAWARMANVLLNLDETLTRP